MTKNKSMTIHKARLPESHLLEGLVVVIDVIRAFTTASFAFATGVEKMYLVGTADEAFQLHQRMPHALLAGEDQGIIIPGFHYDNSPVSMGQAPIRGKTLIFRTSSGTQGVVRSVLADRILVSSFVVAEATLQRIQALSPEKINFLVTGTNRGGEEDLALADYLEARLKNGEISATPFLERVVRSPSGMAFASGLFPQFNKHDLTACCQLDKFPFALEVRKEEGLHVLRPVNHLGEVYR